MKKIMLTISLISLHLNFAMATGIAMRTTCAPVIADEGQPVIVFRTLTMTPPGGPVTTTGSVNIDGKEYKMEKKGNYEQGLKIKNVPLKYPSGAVSSSIAFITLNPGKSTVAAVNEVLYKCDSKPGSGN